MNKKIRLLFILSLTLNMLFFTVSSVIIYKKGGSNWIVSKTRHVFINNEVEKEFQPIYYDKKIYSQYYLILTTKLYFWEIA